MKHKFFFFLFTIFTICIILFSACKKERITEVTLNKTELMLEIGETETLIATIHPENATNKNLTWESTNPAVATVNNNGLVTTLKKGDAIITVTTEEGNKKATCAVKIQDYRDKWVGEYKGIHKHKHGENSFNTFPCNIYVTYEALSYYIVDLKFETSGEFPFEEFPFKGIYTKLNYDGSFSDPKFYQGNFYQDSLIITFRRIDENYEYLYIDEFYVKKIKNN